MFFLMNKETYIVLYTSKLQYNTQVLLTDGPLDNNFTTDRIRLP